MSAFTGSQLRDAMNAHGSASAAARELGITIPKLGELSYRVHLGSLFQRVLRADSGQVAPWIHPGFKDMTGAKLFDGAVEVVERVANTGNGNARWKIRFAACGHTRVMQGIEIRSRRSAPRCPDCAQGRTQEISS